MDQNSELGLLPTRRKHLFDGMFSSRTGSFSPRGHGMTSEIPRNTVEFEPSNSLFVENSGCGCRRAYSRHKRNIHRFSAILVCLIFFAVIIGPLTYHFVHSNGGVKEAMQEWPLKHPDTVTDKSPGKRGGGAAAGLGLLAETSDEEHEESAEALSPFDAPPPDQRVTAHILKDTRDVDGMKRKRGAAPLSEDIIPDEDLLGIIDRELDTMPDRRWAGDLLRKFRSRRELRRKSASDEEHRRGKKPLEEGDESAVIDVVHQEESSEVEVEFSNEVLSNKTQDASEKSTEGITLTTTESTPPPSTPKVQNSMLSNTVVKQPVSRHLDFAEWQELDHFLNNPDEIRSYPIVDNQVDSQDIEEALEEAKMLRKRLALAKMRYKRTLPAQRYVARKYFKEDCNGLDCNDDVGLARFGGRTSALSVQEKLEALLKEIREVRQKLTGYEKKLKGITRPPFEEFSLAYPTVPPMQPFQFPPELINGYPDYLPELNANEIQPESIPPAIVNHDDLENEIDNEINSNGNENYVAQRTTKVPSATEEIVHDVISTTEITTTDRAVTTDQFEVISSSSSSILTDVTPQPTTGITNPVTESAVTTSFISEEVNPSTTAKTSVETESTTEILPSLFGSTDGIKTTSHRNLDDDQMTTKLGTTSAAVQTSTLSTAGDGISFNNAEEYQGSSTLNSLLDLEANTSIVEGSTTTRMITGSAAIVDSNVVDNTLSSNGIFVENDTDSIIILTTTTTADTSNKFASSSTQSSVSDKEPKISQATLNAERSTTGESAEPTTSRTLELSSGDGIDKTNTNLTYGDGLGDGVTKHPFTLEVGMTSENLLAGEPSGAEPVTEKTPTTLVNIESEESRKLSSATSTVSEYEATFASIAPAVTDATAEETESTKTEEVTTEGSTSQSSTVAPSNFESTSADYSDNELSVEKVDSNEDENFIKSVNNEFSSERESPFSPGNANEKRIDPLSEGDEEQQENNELNEGVANVDGTEVTSGLPGYEETSTFRTGVTETTSEKDSGEKQDEPQAQTEDSSSTVERFSDSTPLSQPERDKSNVESHSLIDLMQTGDVTISQETTEATEFQRVSQSPSPNPTENKVTMSDTSHSSQKLGGQAKSAEIMTADLLSFDDSLLSGKTNEEVLKEFASSDKLTPESTASKSDSPSTLTKEEEETTGQYLTLTATTPIGSIEDDEDRGEQTLMNSKIHHSLEKKMFEEDQDTNVTPHPESDLHGMSLDDARNRKQASKKFESKVVTASSDLAVPTGPDSAIGVGETSNSGQQFSYSPYQSFAVPFQICYYANSPAKHSIEPRAPQSKTLPLLAPTFHIPSLTLPGFNEPPAPPAAKPGPNIYNIVMTNSPAPSPINQPHMPMLFSPGVMTFPPQQHMARYMNGQQALLFCSAMHSQYQSPTMPGTAEFSHSRCRNCDDDSLIKKQAPEASVDDFEKETGTLECPEGLSRCKDDQLCIPSAHWCDGRVHCTDASDEMHCSCRDRISDVKRCDGYTDCPKGEDEAGCNDCPSTSFSCGTWDEDGACIPLSKRCDGSVDCSNGRDEMHCSLLTPSPANITAVNYMEGFLLRNWRGEWYPVCSETGRQSWASQACDTDGDPGTDQRDLPEYVKGPFLTHRSDGDFVLEHHCKGHVATHVQCSPHRCGTRVVDPPPNDIASRFRRLVEHRDAPADAAERPIQAWWEKMKQKIEEEYHVEGVTAKIFPAEPYGVVDHSRAERSVSDSGRVVGGKASSPNSWPWAVALYKDGLFHCGGTLLDSEWVLTAAHCVVNFQEHYYEANIGMLRRSSFAPMQKVVPIGQIVVHSKYEPKTMKNDIAMMRLREPVQMNHWVHPTCLPTSARNRQGMWAPAPGTKCVAVGWGAVKEHGTDPDHLREVEVPILSRCKHREDIEGDEICAGLVQGGKDTCQGDSGGPLMCRDGNSAWYIAGIVSHGEGCARPDEAGAYTRVGLYIDWIVAATDSSSADSALAECPGFQCSSHPGRCLPSRMQCNGIVDCLGGEDEKGCVARNRFENLWRSSKSSEEDSPMLQSKREQPHPDQPIFSYKPTVEMPGLFRCTDIIQTISHSRICDGIQDCEDASDEVNCTCRDRIMPSKVCDGRVHCADVSDELGCFECPQGYFNCRGSQQCIVIEKKCDEVQDCVSGEDEEDCSALTKTFNLVIEVDGRPKYENEGFLAVNRRGVWTSFCVENRETLSNKPASSVCRQLGLSGFLQYDTVDIGDVTLDITDHSDEFLSMNIAKRASNCSALSVTCQPYNSATKEASGGVTKTWEALVRVDGSVTCTAVLLTENWILASTKCISENQTNARLIAEVGRQIYPAVMSEINAVERINGTGVLLLHLNEAVNETHGLRPLRLSYRETLEDLTDCLVMGGNRTVPVVLDTLHCSPDKVCVSRIGSPARHCRSAPWTGVAVCNSPDGWLPVGVFAEAGGYCGFQSSVFTNVLKFRKHIESVIESPVTPMENGACDGYLCMGGLCISNEETCDGRPNCPYADDEGDAACSTRNTTVCGRDELTCDNGQCTKLQNWSDGMKQCEDGSDETPESKCAGYLQRTAVDKICDGSRHCIDKSDEDPVLCNGRGASFKCSSSNVSIPVEFVCDGEEDCFKGEDEQQCVTLHRISKFSKEYEYHNVSYGLSHAMCLATPKAEEADMLCKNAGNERHTSIAMRLTTPKLMQLDHFSSVTLNKMTKLVLRSKRPFATLKPASRKCPVAFVTCL